MEGAVIDFTKRRSDWIGGGVPCAAVTLFKGWRLAAGKGVLLTVRIFLYCTPKRTGSGRASAIGKLSGVQLEDKPPINWMTICQERYGRALRGCSLGDGLVPK